MAGASGRNPGFNWSIWFFAALDALKEIRHVIDGAVAIALCAEDRILVTRNVLAIDSKSAAVDLQRRICSAELKTAIIDGGTHHSLIKHVEAGIPKRRLNRIGTIPGIEDIF